MASSLSVSFDPQALARTAPCLSGAREALADRLLKDVAPLVLEYNDPHCTFVEGKAQDYFNSVREPFHVRLGLWRPCDDPRCPYPTAIHTQGKSGKHTVWDTVMRPVFVSEYPTVEEDARRGLHKYCEPPYDSKRKVMQLSVNPHGHYAGIHVTDLDYELDICHATLDSTLTTLVRNWLYSVEEQATASAKSS